MRDLSAEDFAFIARLLHRRSGVVLTPDKAGLAGGRLNSVLYRFGLKDVAHLVRELRLGNDSLAAALAEAITINDSSFFRGESQFDALRRLLPKILAARTQSKRLRIWSAACAAGQEAYSIAMMLDEFGLLWQGWTIDLIATDLSGEALARAEKGQFTPFEVRHGLSAEQLARCFVSENGGYTVTPRLRRMVKFRRFNLLDSYGWLDELDLVFCRNVLIYFDRATKSDILERIAGCMCEDGLLLLGEAESPQGITPVFRDIPGHANIAV